MRVASAGDWDAAKKGAGEAFVAGLSAGIGFPPLIVLGPLFAPIGFIAGGPFGSHSGSGESPVCIPSTQDIKSTSNALKHLKPWLVSVEFNNALRDAVVETAHERTRLSVVPLMDVARFVPGEGMTYRSLSSEGVGIVLEIALSRVVLEDSWLEVEMRLVRVSDDVELYRNKTTYKACDCSFVGWAWEDAQQFLNKLQYRTKEVSRILAQKIVSNALCEEGCL